jgi:Ca2+-binding RTX toxin-like protein
MDANADGVNASRFTITVAATDDTGGAAWYSNFGSSILIAAPAAEVTTDLSGSAGYDPTDYTDEFGGTSAATPVTSGVIALMLDAAQGLGWRDVQNILAASATLTGASYTATAPGLEEDGTWQSNNAGTWNGGGFHIHTNYGFGMINVFNAVRMAEVWSLFGKPQTSANELSVTGRNNFADVIVTQSGIQRSIEVTKDLTVEHVALTLEVDSDQLMDLKVVLISPDGTKVTVVLDDTKLINPFDAIDGKWTYGIDVLRGESAQGTWTVKVFDMRGAGTTTLLESAELTIYGSAASANDVHHITEEFTKMKGHEFGRSVVTDSNGGTDWLNFAAVAGDVSLDLTAGTFGANGKAWGTLSGTFERAVSGDGDDMLKGNNANNHLHGMRGQDVLYGAKGNDTLNGGDLGDRLYGEGNKDSLYGEDGADRLQGGEGEDFLHGGAGNDMLVGGAGGDTYRFGKGDKISETANGGIDKVNSDVNHSLASQVERLSLIGTADINGTGNGLANVINGNSGDNTLDGRDGSDQLNGKGGNDRLIGGAGGDTFDGGAGADIMTGGAGPDVFRFTVKPDGVVIDEITDFQSGVDRIFLSDTAFRALSDGALEVKAFASNTSGTAQDASDRIIYEEDTGILWYDSNGNAAGGRVQFAKLDAGLTLTAADFFVF